ncbi:MAG: WD40 repeat domain-containing protein [Sulfurimonas sp.]|nr:WD40 repeat domain-containing protein [Sulfurimonas sp.]MDD3834224.1 WD40 repeat domain-containing protein [Sulfurimonas sp.]
MFYKLLSVLLLVSGLYAAGINQPSQSMQTSGFVVDLVAHDGKLYCATDASSLDIFDIETKELLEVIKVEQITDFMGDTIDSKIYSVDVMDDAVMILSQAEKGARRVHIYKDKKLELIIPYTDGLFIAKAKFLDKNTLLLGLLSNEIISYDLKNKKQNYKIQVSQSKFSDFVLIDDKTRVVVADESGNLKIHNIKDGSFSKMLGGQNLDNVFQVDSKKGIIATAGQDRKVVVYNLNNGSNFYKMASFLIYSVAISPSAKLVAYSNDEEGNVEIFKVSTHGSVGLFGGNKGTISKILFLNEKEFFISSDSTTLNYYKIN